MLINQANLSILFQGFSAAFNSGLETAEKHYLDIAMKVSSASRENVYAWMGQMPSMREWLGPRVIKNLALHGYTIKNKDFESTIGVSRNDIEDDQYGVLKPVLTEMGLAAGDHPNQLVFSLLARGFEEKCYDGQFFFDTDHPVGDGESAPASVSNLQAGSDPAWFLLDTTRQIKPMVFQERKPVQFVKKDQPSDDNVFLEKEFIYGADGRSNVGFGLWQLAFASKAALTAANYKAARSAMMSFKGDNGRPLNVRPNVLVVPPELESAAMQILNNGTRVEIVSSVPVAVQNEWKDTAKPIVTAWLL